MITKEDYVYITGAQRVTVYTGMPWGSKGYCVYRYAHDHLIRRSDNLHVKFH